MEKRAVFPFGPGSLVVKAEAGKIVEIAFLSSRIFSLPSDPLLKQAYLQFTQYAQGKRRFLCVPFAFPRQATPFQLRVWKRVLEIPYGSVVTYGNLARTLGTSPRAVGSALRKNKLPLLIPCHRVVAANGLGGFSGNKNLEFKEFLLALEGSLHSIKER